MRVRESPDQQSIRIRAYKPEDRETIREISRKVALEKPVVLFQEDPELAPMLYVDYYLDHEAESCFVAEQNGRVIGYIVGCKDSRKHELEFSRRIMPRALRRIFWRLITFRFRRVGTYHTLWINLLAHLNPSRMDRFDLPEGYPASSHTNVDPDHRSKGLGFAMGVVLHEHLRSLGIKGLHAIVIERKGSERLSEYFCRERAYKLAGTRPHILHSSLTGQEWIMKLLVCDLEEEMRKKSV